MPLSEPRLAGSLGIDQPQSQAASLSTGRSAGDDTFPDSALSMAALEWNPQPCLLAAKRISINLFLTNSVFNRSLNLIGLWGSGKTKTANLSCARLNRACHWTLLQPLRQRSAKFGRKKNKTWQSHFRCSDVTQSFWLKKFTGYEVGSALMWGL